jgi:DNA-binding SARP family transcriptional activator
MERAAQELEQIPSLAKGTAAPAAQGELLPGVFEALAHGVVVFDLWGSVVAANAAARALLGASPRPGSGGDRRLCCRLFGCRGGSGPLADACLGELALDAGRARPEIRLDLPAGSAADAAWVTASPLPGEEGVVILQLRPASPHDRRRRTDPHWMGSSRVRILTLGQTDVESRETSLGGAWLGQRTGQLLKFLVCQRGRAVRPDEIALALWPKEDARALGSVRYYVHALRDVLEPGRRKRAPSSFVIGGPDGYMLDPNRVEIDADLFEQRVRTGVSAFMSNEFAIATASLEDALQTYGGDFLPEEAYSVWSFDERERLRRLAAQACRTLAELSIRTGELEAATAHVERLHGFTPWDTYVQQALLTLYLKRGHRSEAWRRFELMRQGMLREFGHELEFSLSDLSAADDVRLVTTAPSAG